MGSGLHHGTLSPMIQAVDRPGLLSPHHSSPPWITIHSLATDYTVCTQVPLINIFTNAYNLKSIYYPFDPQKNPIGKLSLFFFLIAWNLSLRFLLLYIPVFSAQDIVCVQLMLRIEMNKVLKNIFSYLKLIELPQY